MRLLVGVLVVMAAPAAASAQRWQDATAQCLGTTAEWTNKVELADVDGDGHVDILVANGGNYSSPGTAEPARAWKNLGNWTASGLHCSEITAEAFGGFTGLSRMIKAADVDGDGDLDILTGGAYQTQAKLFIRGATTWTDGSAQLPQQNTSIGDAEFGDVDGDGDLDLVLADWGAANPSSNPSYQGGRTRLYRNNGSGAFTDETAVDMPAQLVRWSWDLELADVDNDWDLDVLVSCKYCTTSYLFRNDGAGHFTDDPAALPHFANNYEFEPMDIDADGDLDLITINDGASISEHIFVNRGDGTFADETSTRLTGTANPAGVDDNAAVWLDVDSDGDADLLIATLQGDPDRLLLNDGAGNFTLSANATPTGTAGSLGLAIADLNGDGRLDVVQGQGELAFPEKLQLGGAMVDIDSRAPVVKVEPTAAAGLVRARIHDFTGPSHLHDFKKVVVKVGANETPMRWYGEMLWRADVAGLPATYEVCATDRQDNTTCASNVPSSNDAGVGGDGGMVDPPSDGGCCDSRGDVRGSLVLALFALGYCRARRRRR